jgi:fermentation-respiration switch protein FrsA (DUF1100 family)
MRKDIEFKAEDGVTLRGWLFRPDNGSGPFPAIVLTHGYSAVKEMGLDKFGNAFAAAGFAALVFDNRNFGASDGMPRQEIDPWRQVRDYRDAITFVLGLQEIDGNRVGVWGSSYSGAHVIVVGAIDRRVKCVVSQAPLVTGSQNVRRLVRGDMIESLRGAFAADRGARYRGGSPAMIPVVSADGPCALPTTDSFSWFTEMGQTVAPSWRNEVTLRSVEMLMEYEPSAYLPHVSPTPLLMIVGKRDHLTIAELALQAFERALEPKRLVLLDAGHFDVYGEAFDAAAGSAVQWFKAHL